MKDPNLTYYAPAARSSRSEILRQHDLVLRNVDSVDLLDEMVTMVALLNSNRQIVWANRALLEAAGATADQALGKRPGELFGCIHAFEVNGCGTSPKCASCGAVRTLVRALGGADRERFIEECCLVAKTNIFDLRVSSSKVTIGNEQFVLCSIYDISDEKRRGIMERLFFHDVLNSVSGIHGIAQALSHYHQEGEMGEMTELLQQMVRSLTEEIEIHKMLTLAEKGQYEGKLSTIQTLDTLRAEAAKYDLATAAASQRIEIDPESENHGISVDWVLLSRVLCNMFRNALEAEPAGAVITAGTYKDSDGDVVFYVHNASVIPPQEALQVFERSFSTKGANRGLGTYGMKLLTEHYLEGQVGFTSSEGRGTRFEVRLPGK